MSESPIPTLVVMARWPASGRCKSRLAVDIGSEQAAIIQQRLTAHTFAVAEALNEPVSYTHLTLRTKRIV